MTWFLNTWWGATLITLCVFIASTRGFYRLVIDLNDLVEERTAYIAYVAGRNLRWTTFALVALFITTVAAKICSSMGGWFIAAFMLGILAVIMNNIYRALRRPVGNRTRNAG